jgi:translation initiation factor IF-1
MAKEEGIKMDGIVAEVLPNAMFRVKMKDTDALITGIISGRMRKNNIKILLGDTVEVEFSLYDMGRGRITRRR